jgi:hypothetical protein
MGLVALRARRAAWAAAFAALGPAAGTVALGAEPPSPPPARVEAHSSDLLAVGTVQGSRMVIHVSRTADNAPVRDAAVSVTVRGASHPAVAQTDGSYSVDTPDLSLPGAAAIGFEVTQGASHENLTGTLDVAAPGADKSADTNGNTRQLGWWVLNFGVCIGFLMLWRRRKSRQPQED